MVDNSGAYVFTSMDGTPSRPRDLETCRLEADGPFW